MLGWPAAAVAAVLAMGCAGCATIQTSGTPQSMPTPPPPGSAGGPACCVPIYQPPQPSWSPERVVSGFLSASALFANNHALARQYLTPQASRSWKPYSKVTILKRPPHITPEPQGVRGPGPGAIGEVVTGKMVATLSSTGQYQPAPPGRATKETFGLVSVNGRYLINGLPNASPAKPSHQLLLTSYQFHHSYAPRNVYYYGMRDGSLVPDPVFVPAEYENPAPRLIDDLLHDPTGWLQGTAKTAFPAGAKLAKLQVLPGPSGGKIAIVDIALRGRVAGRPKEAMAKQLVATLIGPAYSRALFQGVKFKINGRLWWPPSHNPLLTLASFPQNIPHWAGNSELYYLTSQGRPRVLGVLAPRGATLAGGQSGLSQIAVAPDKKNFAAIGGLASTVYTSRLPSGSGDKSGGHQASVDLRSRLAGTSFTSLSWDSQDYLWVAGRRRHTQGVWVLARGRGRPVLASLPGGTGPVTSLRVAPDGVRIAMIVGTGASARVMLGAIGPGLVIPQVVPLGAGMTGVRALTWYDDDHLLVVKQDRKRQTSLWDVPANEDSGTWLSGLNGITSVAAAGPKNPLYLSLSGGQLEKSVGLRETWTDITAGMGATYPG